MQTGDRLTGGHKPTLRNPKTKYRVFHNDGPKVFACYSKNKTKYFRLRLTDEVSSERPETDLRLT